MQAWIALHDQAASICLQSEAMEDRNRQRLLQDYDAQRSMRLKSHIWVSAYLRRLDVAFIHGVVIRRGDADAGSIYVKVSRLDGLCQVFAPMSFDVEDIKGGLSFLQEDGRSWQEIYKVLTPEADADAYLNRQASRDPDIWILEVESAQGRHLLGATSYAFT